VILAHLVGGVNRRLPFGGADLFPNVGDKAGRLCWHAAMETFFILNGAEIDASVDDQNDSSWISPLPVSIEPNLIDWLRQHLTPLPDRCRPTFRMSCARSAVQFDAVVSQAADRSRNGYQIRTRRVHRARRPGSVVGADPRDQNRPPS